MGFIASTPATYFRGRGAVADRSLKARRDRLVVSRLSECSSFASLRATAAWHGICCPKVEKKVARDGSPGASATHPVRWSLQSVQRLGEIRSAARSSRHFPLRRAAVTYRSGDNRRAPERRKPVVQRHSDRGQLDLHRV